MSFDRIKNITIGQKLFLGFLLAVATSTFFILYFSYETARDRLENQFLSSLELTADAKEKHIVSFFDQVEADLSRFSASAEMKGFFVDQSHEGGHGVLEKAQAVRGDIFGVDILDIKGSQIFTTLPKNATIEEARSSYLKRITQGSPDDVYVTDIFGSAEEEGTVGEHDIFFVGVAPIRKETFIAGYAAYYFTLDHLQPLFESNTDLSMYLVNRRGVIVGRSSALDDLAILREVKTLPVEKCVAGGGVSGQYRDYKGESVIGASACVDRLTFIIEMPAAEVLGAADDLQRRMSIAALLVFVELLIVVYFMTKLIVRPIRELAAAVKRFGEGNWEHRVNVGARDDIGVLGERFNAMADTLQDLYENLEDKVRLRTEDLQKFKLAVEFASDQITITDVQGIVLYTNKAAEQLTGYRVPELIGKPASQWRKTKRDVIPVRIVEKMKRTGQAVQREMVSIRKGGSSYIADVRISPIFDEKGELRFFVMIEHDITKAKEIDREKSEFVSLASHQLRTPLSAINWYTEMLLAGDAGPLSDEQQKYLKEVYIGGQRMVELVNSLLNVSRIELGTFSIDHVDINLPDTAESVFSELEPQISGKHIVIRKDFAPDVPVLKGDLQLVRIVFQNLLSNAVKYTPEGGEVSLNISVGDIPHLKGGDKHGVLITVRDSGYGIPLHQQHKIFTKLFRADNAKERVPEGNGLGLYLVKSLVEQAGGAIWFESEEGKGTTFCVAFPFSGMKDRKGTRKLSLS